MSASHGRTSYGRSKSHKGAVSLFILAGIAVVAAGAFVVTSAGKVSLAGATGSSGSRSAKLVATRPWRQLPRERSIPVALLCHLSTGCADPRMPLRRPR